MKASEGVRIETMSACAICGTNPAREGGRVCEECMKAELFPCNRAITIDPRVCWDYDGTLYTCQTCKHPNKQRKEQIEPQVDFPEWAESNEPDFGNSWQIESLPTCPHCHEPVNPEDLHPIRKGWHTRCVTESMREAKSAKKAQKKQTKPEPKPGPEPEAVPMIPKTCMDCGEQFAPYKHGSTWPNICLTCMRKRSREGMREKWLKHFKNEGYLMVDMGMITDLLLKIEQDAAACLRSPEAQCLWYILERAREL